MRYIRWAATFGLGLIGVIIALNRHGLGDGLAYLHDLLTYDPTPEFPVKRDGRYAALYDLVVLDNRDRERYIGEWLASRGLTPQWLPIPNSPQGNWLVRLGPPGPVTLFVAHWDKIYERPSYQAASDNSSGVAVLLAAVDTVNRTSPARPLAFLWTGEEERGLQGGRAFVEWAALEDFRVQDVYNFDMLGRGGLVARPVTRAPGFVFYLPGLGWQVYDGRQVRPTELHKPVDPATVSRLHTFLPTLHIAQMMTATGDTNTFEAAGWPGVMLSGSNIHYLNLTWHNDYDRVELIDERNLDLAYDLILALAG